MKATAFVVSVRMTAAVWPSLMPPTFPVMEQLVSEKPFTPVPLIAPAELFWMFMNDRSIFFVLVSKMELLDVF